MIDQDVCRWYDRAMNKKCDKIPFLSINDNLEACQSGKVFLKCGGGGSVRYAYEASSHEVLYSHVTVYPTPGSPVQDVISNQKQLHSNMQGKTAYYFCVFIAILNCNSLQTKTEMDSMLS